MRKGSTLALEFMSTNLRVQVFSSSSTLDPQPTRSIEMGFGGTLAQLPAGHSCSPRATICLGVCFWHQILHRNLQVCTREEEPSGYGAPIWVLCATKCGPLLTSYNGLPASFLCVQIRCWFRPCLLSAQWLLIGLLPG